MIVTRFSTTVNIHDSLKKFYQVKISNEIFDNHLLIKTVVILATKRYIKRP